MLNTGGVPTGTRQRIAGGNPETFIWDIIEGYFGHSVLNPRLVKTCHHRLPKPRLQLQKLGTDCSHRRLVMSSPRYQNCQRLVVEENKLPRRRTIDPPTASIRRALSEQ
ncbi:uncharacterized protein LOC143189973 [Rhynchophorus ferrugineus]|uniref:uncharacterized protein LOC143189973 n=1 Tax=Rhynchophorus ferrugineus TaxID=354439 RepID=UPI003FCD80DA